MNYLSSFKKLSQAKQVAVVLVASTLTWAIGVPVFFTTASAVQMTQVSATASSSALGAISNYIIRFTSTTTAPGNSTITFQLDPTTSSFVINGSLTFADITSPNVAMVASCTAGNQAILSSFTNNPDVITITLCAAASIPAGPVSFSLGNSRITNPGGAGSYKVSITGGAGWTDSATTMVAILSQVTVTASVDTTLTFTVAGVASGQQVNNEQVSTTSSATAIGFGTLASGTPVIAAQDLTVSTNAQNGFIVTVHEDQNLLSANGADIDLFSDGSQVFTPVAWATPTAALGVENTYGHIGLTSNDTDLNANEFFSGSVIKWTGAFGPTTTRAIFSHTGPSDGVTQNIGKARIGYKILVSSLQEAATDYTNHLIYICTPTF